MHSNLLNSCQASWWAVHEPRSVGSPNLFTNIRPKMLCNCSGVRKRCVMHSKFPAFVQQPLVSYLYPEQVSKLSKRILVLLSHEWWFWWEVCIVHAQSRNWLQKGSCRKVFASTELHACYIPLKDQQSFFNNESRQSLDFKLGYYMLLQDSCLYLRLCPMQDQESAKCLAFATSEIFRPSPRYSILGTVFASTASLALWVDRKVIHQPEACGQYQPQVERGFRKVVIQLQVAR